MTKAEKSVYGLLRGSFLTDASAFKNWRIIIFIVVLLLCMITSGHMADDKVIQIAELNKKKRKLRAEYVLSLFLLEYACGMPCYFIC